MQEVSNAVPLLKDGADGARLLLITPVTLDFAGYAFRQQLYPYGALRFDRLNITLKIAVQQTRFELDRGAKYDIALAVENYVTRQRNVVARVGGSPLTTLSPPLPKASQNVRAEEVFQNGSLMKIFTDPFVEIDDKVDQWGYTNEIILELPTWTVRRGATPNIGNPASSTKP
jgi:hypothetical protein